MPPCGGAWGAPCTRCSGLQLQLQRSQRANTATARANAAAQSKRDEYECTARLLQKKLHFQAATIALLQEQVAAQEEALRRSADKAMGTADDNLRLRTQLHACESRECGLLKQVAALQEHFVRATANLIDERQAHRLLHDELAESERSLGGAALFWAACYDQAVPIVDGFSRHRRVCGGTLRSEDASGQELSGSFFPER